MCIAIYKPIGVEFPSKRRLKTCFSNNPHGAGFMVATGENVVIHKGFMEFKPFWKALREAREKYGDTSAFVMHFRISTQGGIRQDGCHPFPLSGDMEELRKLDTTCDIGVAHNGIISLTSTGYSKTIDYSDTMKFITDYLSLIIKDRCYFKDDSAIELIDRLCGSRLAILDSRGHCELIGRGWTAVDGVWYSNDSYIEKPVKTTSYYPSLLEWGNGGKSYWDAYDDRYKYDEYDEYDLYLNPAGVYEFPYEECPVVEIGDGSYCEHCIHYARCYDGYDDFILNDENFEFGAND